MGNTIEWPVEVLEKDKVVEKEKEAEVVQKSSVTEKVAEVAQKSTIAHPGEFLCTSWFLSINSHVFEAENNIQR